MKIILLSLLALAPAFAQAPKPWRAILAERLNIYGHRNWIVIADSAYPLQSSPGIETILSSENQVETVRHVFAALARTPHLRPIVHIDRELQYVTDEDAPGIGAYRQLVTGIFESSLPDQKPEAQFHEQIIRQLDEAPALSTSWSSKPTWRSPTPRCLSSSAPGTGPTTRSAGCGKT